MTVITEAISADSAAFDADVVGGGDRVRAEFDLLAADAQTAAQTACQLFLRALEAAVEFGVPEESVVVERLVVAPARDREL